MSCSFRLTTTRPDGRREDIPLDDLLGQSDLLADQVWTEIEREVEQVEISGNGATVTIDRMTSVTFTDFTETRTLQLIFNNPPEGTP